jgi:uncharacterized membrane protein
MKGIKIISRIKEIPTVSNKLALFFSLIACFVSACAIAIVVISCFMYYRKGSLVAPHDVMTLIGLVFSVIGVIATVFFVVITYRAGHIYDEIKAAGNSIKDQMEKEKKVYQELAFETYEALCENYSRLINDCPEKVDEYKLTEARMACKLFLLPNNIREEKIRLLSDIERTPETIADIDDDIVILEKILFDEKEGKTIRKAADESLDTLRKRRE